MTRSLGSLRSQLALLGCLVASLALVAVTPWALAGLLAVPFAVRAHAPVRAGGLGKSLIPALQDSGLAMLVWAVATAPALAFG